jgi:hypothetical protein
MRLIPQFHHSEIGMLYSPILAIALFSGFYLGRKALFIPLVIMGITDYFIGYYDWKLMVAVYGCFAITTLWGKRNFVVGSLLSAIVYFVVTNYAVWQFMGWYPMTWAGLYECYVMAIPYFKNSLIGTLGYSITFFGAYNLAKALCKTKSFFYILPR